MADNELKTRLISAFGYVDSTPSGSEIKNWADVTDIPKKGEVCYGIEGGYGGIVEIKIGNGVDPYADLPAFTDDGNNLYKLKSPVSTTTAANSFSATTYLQTKTWDQTSYSNSSTAELTIPVATTGTNGHAGLMSKDDKTKLNTLNVSDVTYNTSTRNLVIDRYSGNDTTVTFGTMAFKASGDFLPSTTKYAGSTSVGGPASNSLKLGGELPSYYAPTTYVDSLIANATHFKGGFTASGDGAIDGQTGKTFKTEAEKIGDMYTVTTAGTYLGIAFEVGDSIIFKKAVAAGTAPTTADFITVEGETSVSVVDSNPTLKWGTKTQVGTVEGSALNVTGMPAPKSTSTAVIDVINNNNQIEIAHKVSGVTSGSYGDGTHVFKATVDSYGHITSATTVKVPSATTVAEGLTKKPSGTAPILVDADNVITHDNSGVTAGTYGSATSVAQVTVDATGHVTSAKNVAIQTATTTQKGLIPKLYTNDDGKISIDNTNMKINHTTAFASSGSITAGTAGTADNWGESISFTVPEFGYDKTGHLTSTGSKDYKVAIPSIPSIPVTAVIGDGTWTTAATSGNAKTIKISHIGPGSVTNTYGASVAQTPTFGGSFSIPYIKSDGKGHVTTSSSTASVKIPSSVASWDYYTTTAKTAASGEALQVKFDRTDSTAAYMFTIPAATESVSGISSTVSTDRLRNGTKVLVLNGNFTV